MSGCSTAEYEAEEQVQQLLAGQKPHHRHREHPDEIDDIAHEGPDGAPEERHDDAAGEALDIEPDEEAHEGEGPAEEGAECVAGRGRHGTGGSERVRMPTCSAGDRSPLPRHGPVVP